jgi:outer membrane protein
MKNTARLLAVVSTLCLGLLSAQAQLDAHKAYLKGDIGVSLTQDTDLKSFFGESVGGTEIDFDPGLRLGVAAGYQVTEWFSPELEWGFNFNEIKSAGADLDDATFLNMPLLINARFQWPNTSLLTPYAGAGVGFSTVVIGADEMTVGGTTMEGSEADLVFTWQAFAGLRVKLGESIGLSLEYRFIQSQGAEWEAEDTSGTSGDSMSFGKTQTQAISIAFEARF